MKASTLRFLIVISSAILILFLTIAIQSNDAGAPHRNPTQSSTALSSTSNTSSENDIVMHYTRQQLAAMDTTKYEYSTGIDFDEKNRPINALRLEKEYGKYNAHFIGPDDGKIYLTYNFTYEFDGLVQKTLDILKDKNVKCVIFIDKSFAVNHPQMIRQILNDGHILANHCTTHPDLPTLSMDEITQQIMDVHNYVKETYNYEMKYFRPPSGYYSEQVWAIAQNLGYRSYNWSYAYRDWDTNNQPDPDFALQTIIEALHSGAIYQLHGISSTNAVILEDFIDATRAQGYEFALLP